MSWRHCDPWLRGYLLGLMEMIEWYEGSPERLMERIHTSLIHLKELGYTDPPEKKGEEREEDRPRPA